MLPVSNVCGFFIGSPKLRRVKEMIVKYADRRKNIINPPGSIYIIVSFMEKGNITRNEYLSDPFWSMHQDIEDEKMGIKTFEEIRQAWRAWARQYLQEFQSQADVGNLASQAGIIAISETLPDSNPADTTA